MHVRCFQVAAHRIDKIVKLTYACGDAYNRRPFHGVERVSKSMPIDDELFAAAPSVSATAPDGRLISLSVSRERIRQLAQLGKYNDIFAYFYNLCGIQIPVNNFGYHEQKAGLIFPDHWGGIRHAHLIYKGIQRPFREAKLDSDVYIYVTAHSYAYRYVPDMVCCAKRVDVPSNNLFVAYVIFADGDFEKGVVTAWEWVLCDSQDKKFPKDHSIRYEEKVGENG